MTYTVQEIRDLFDGDGVDAFDELVVEGDWTQEHKNQFSTDIIRHGDQFFQIDQCRSGSYHTDWYYDEPTIVEVARHEEVVTKTVVKWIKKA